MKRDPLAGTRLVITIDDAGNITDYESSTGSIYIKHGIALQYVRVLETVQQRLADSVITVERTEEENEQTTDDIAFDDFDIEGYPV